MIRKAPKIIKPLLLALFIGILCNFLWLYEILSIKSWVGLNWLNGYMNSVFLIIPLTVSTYVLSMRLLKRISIKNILFAILILSFISFISFELARRVLYIVHSKFFVLSYSQLSSILLISTGILVPNLIFSIGYYYVTNKFLIKTAKRTILLFLGTVILCIAFSLLSIKLVSGYGSGHNFIDSVKMGYPVFWLNILLCVSAVIIFKTKAHK